MKTIMGALAVAPLIASTALPRDLPDYDTARMCADLWHGYSRATQLCQTKEMRYKVALADVWHDLSEEAQQVCDGKTGELGGSYRALLECIAIHSD